jgi:hypothetical protein
MVANFNHITRSLIGTICKTFSHLKFIYSEKATKFFEIFTLLLSYAVPVQSKVKILQNFVAFSECMTFTPSNRIRLLLIFFCHIKSKQNLFWHFLIFFSMLMLCKYHAVSAWSAIHQLFSTLYTIKPSLVCIVVKTTRQRPLQY